MHTHWHTRTRHTETCRRACTNTLVRARELSHTHTCARTNIHNQHTRTHLCTRPNTRALSRAPHTVHTHTHTHTHTHSLKCWFIQKSTNQQRTMPQPRTRLVKSRHIISQAANMTQWWPSDITPVKARTRNFVCLLPPFTPEDPGLCRHIACRLRTRVGQFPGKSRVSLVVVAWCLCFTCGRYTEKWWCPRLVHQCWLVRDGRAGGSGGGGGGQKLLCSTTTSDS